MNGTTPFRVGLTGTVAAGKSMVARNLAERGAAVIDSDELAREIVRPGSPAYARIREAFGEGVIAPDGTLDRSALREATFADKRSRERLEEISHAGIRELRARRISEAAAAGVRVIVEEIPLLFEVGLENDYDMLVVVDAPREVREARALGSRGWTAEEFAAIDAAQLAASEKRRRADRVLDNRGDPGELDIATRELWREILRAAVGSGS
ncbi:dephospho-CoA kinase [Candidatus Palauibacter sp.]|uniref:dephospho-CoA kinase n=1 Tax=Candidatus Palauibacter sp. TaxID=3101350 RepID=UPI003B52E668